jgi:hypothetical protein
MRISLNLNFAVAATAKFLALHESKNAGKNKVTVYECEKNQFNWHM